MAVWTDKSTRGCVSARRLTDVFIPGARPPDPVTMEQVTIELDEEDAAALEERSERTGQSREATIRELLDAWLDERRE